MAQRAPREPTMEEIVVALRDARRSADKLQPFPVAKHPRANTNIGSTDLADLRDTEIERLLAENARLNARVISLLKVLEQEQANSAQLAVEAPVEADREAIYRDVRAALEAELGPLLLVLLRVLHGRGTTPAADDRSEAAKVALPATTEAPPSEWIIELMHKLEGKVAGSDEATRVSETTPRLPKLRQCVADVLGAFGLESAAAAPRRRFPSTEDPI